MAVGSIGQLIGATENAGGKQPLRVVLIDSSGGYMTSFTATATLPSTSLAGSSAVLVDFDTGAGSMPLPLIGLGLPASGGAVAGGTTTNPIRVDLVPATGAALSNVTSSATNVTLLAANAARRGATIVNDSTAILYVKFAATATTSSFTYKLLAGDTLELPHPVYVGIIDGIWSAANGAARVTEVT